MLIKHMEDGKCTLVYIVGGLNDEREPKVVAGDPEQCRVLTEAADGQYYSCALSYYPGEATEEQIIADFSRDSPKGRAQGDGQGRKPKRVCFGDSGSVLKRNPKPSLMPAMVRVDPPFPPELHNPWISNGRQRFPKPSIPVRVRAGAPSFEEFLEGY